MKRKIQKRLFKSLCYLWQHEIISDCEYFEFTRRLEHLILGE